MENNLPSDKLMTYVTRLLTGSKITLVENDDQFKNAVQLGKDAKAIYNELEEERVEKVSPLNTQLKFINSAYKEKLDAIDGMLRNIRNVCGEYQIKQQEIAREKERQALLAQQAEQKRLADEADRKMREEEALRKEAEEKQKQAEQAASQADRDRLEAEATTATRVAEVAQQEAESASRAVEEVKLEVVHDPISVRGFSAKYTYHALVDNPREALRWLLENEWSALNTKSLVSCIEACADRVARFKKEEFKVPGCSLQKIADSKINPYKMGRGE